MITEPITDHSHEKCLFLCMKKPLKTANFNVYSAVFKEQADKMSDMILLMNKKTVMIKWNL